MEGPGGERQRSRGTCQRPGLTGHSSCKRDTAERTKMTFLGQRGLALSEAIDHLVVGAYALHVGAAGDRRRGMVCSRAKRTGREVWQKLGD